MANLIVEEKFINARELKDRLTGNFREIHVEQLMAIIDEIPGYYFGIYKSPDGSVVSIRQRGKQTREKNKKKNRLL